jgi:hypothetical protein
MAGASFAIAALLAPFSTACSAGQIFARKSRTDLASSARSESDSI